MTSEIDEFRASLVAAVQAELERHASAVVAEVDRLREEQQRETASLRSDVNEQMRALAQIVEQMQTRNDAQLDKTRSTIDQRVGEAESASTKQFLLN